VWVGALKKAAAVAETCDGWDQLTGKRRPVVLESEWQAGWNEAYLKSEVRN
jgi:hypothetical protein